MIERSKLFARNSPTSRSFSRNGVNIVLAGKACSSIWAGTGHYLRSFGDFADGHPLCVGQILFRSRLECLIDVPGINIYACLCLFSSFFCKKFELPLHLFWPTECRTSLKQTRQKKTFNCHRRYNLPWAQRCVSTYVDR